MSESLKYTIINIITTTLVAIGIYFYFDGVVTELKQRNQKLADTPCGGEKIIEVEKIIYGEKLIEGKSERCVWSAEILPPPQWHSIMPEKLMTNHEREVYVKWDEIPGARRYHVYLEDLEGKLLKLYRAGKGHIYLKEIPLPPGTNRAQYQLRLATTNGYDIPGEKGPARPLNVRPQAEVKPPNIKELRVEE